MINSRKTSDLLPQVEALALKLIHECAEKGIDLIVTSTYRDFESQRALYAQGRTVFGPIVTKAMPGHSWHNWKRAFDVVPVVAGKAVWEDDLLWHRIGNIGRSIGLEWGGHFRSFKDLPHFQYTEGFALGGLCKQYPKGLDYPYLEETYHPGEVKK